MNGLEGQAALVTGAGGGIGAACVRRLREAGARVVGLDLSPGDAADIDLAGDVTDAAAITAAGARGEDLFGRPVQIVIHAAARQVHGGILDTAPNGFAALYDVNVLSAVRLFQVFVPGMRRAGDGTFVLLSSINADFATPSLAAYAASKAALNNLAKTAALELAPDRIRVNVVAPASIDTPLLRDSFDRTGDPATARTTNIARHPLRRLGTAEDVAGLAVFLASTEAAWITGGIHYVDGGAHVTRS